jgi:hypothetical protein
MRIGSKAIRLVRQDRPRRIDDYIDYFGAPVGPALVDVAFATHVKRERGGRHRGFPGRSRPAG